MHDKSPALQAPTEMAERRCWRCLQMFPGDADRSPLVRDEFWLCDQCEATLLPSKRRATA
jgi:hypothetical protein